MVVKRFVAADMKEAMEKIRQELGPDAVIMDSNPIRNKGLGGLFRQGVEVVAAYEPTASRPPEMPVAPPVQENNAARMAGPGAEKPLRAVHPAVARYAAVQRQEPGRVIAEAHADVRAGEVDEAAETAAPAELEPVIFPAFEMPEMAAEMARSMPGPEPEPEPERIAELMRRLELDFRSEPVRRPDPMPEPAHVPKPPKPEPVSREAEKPAARPQVQPLVQFETEQEPLSDQIASLKDAVQDFTQRMSLMTKDSTLALPPDILNLYSGLIDRDVPEDMARQLAAQTQMAQSRRNVKAETAAQQIIMDKLGVTSSIKLKAYRQNVLFFMGPTGAGKTTTLVKLAGMLMLEHKLKVGLVNMDTYRVGAMEHMRIYADIMDLPMRTAYTPADLRQALDELTDRDVVLVDTAGKSPGDENYHTEMVECLKAAQADEIFLVISVATGHRATREIIGSYSFLSDYKLILTKLDEVTAWGNVLHIKELTGKPLAYVTVGQNVPDDIRPADTKKLADNIAGKKVSVL